MHRNGDARLRDDFPLPTSISLRPLIRRLHEAAADPDSPWKPLADGVMGALDAAPELMGRLTDEDIRKHRGLIARLMTMVFPGTGRDRLIGAATEPYRMRPVYETEEARRLGVFTLDNLIHHSNFPQEIVRAGLAMSAYQAVLVRFYGVESPGEPDLVVTIPAENGLKRHLQLTWADDFLEVELRGELPPLSPQDLGRIQGDPLNIEMVSSLLPPDRFELTGIGIVTATDVTPREVVSRLKDDLIHRDALSTPARVEGIQNRIRNLIRSPEAVVGFIAFDESADIEHFDWARPVGNSLLFQGGELPCCPHKAHSVYADVLARKQPIVLQDLSGDQIVTGYEAHLASLGFRSFLLCPLVMDDTVVGLLEVGSPVANDLNAFSAMMLIDVAPLFTSAIQRTVEQQADRIEAVIKKNYTSIHPAVEWRFRRAAVQIMKESGEGRTPSVPEIVFDDVYPLYGLADIRGSSARRNLAIRADLIRQIELARAAIQAGAVAKPMMALDEIAYRLDRYLARINDAMGGDDEQAALEFLAREVEPLLPRIETASDGAAARVRAYREALDPRLGVVYQQRRGFEASVSSINTLVSGLIDEQEERAQTTAPHLFERFKTDGVDYNLYVGESISTGGRFHPLLLSELRLWQLALHCRIEWKVREVAPTLEIPMELTHLVLVQDMPLSIRFRTDEKRFDVDGAYNIRYEIVKKRIDKATVRGTGERLTQPGTIAIVFSQNHEGQEYRRYLRYLAHTGFVQGTPTEVELDDLQGVYGLRALRVEIASNAPAEDQGALEVPAAVRRRLATGAAPPGVG